MHTPPSAAARVVACACDRLFFFLVPALLSVSSARGCAEPRASRARLVGSPWQLNKEKEQRRAWAAHSRSQEIFEVSAPEFEQLEQLKGTLANLCAEPSATGVTDPNKPQLSNRKKLKQLRDEIRTTLANVDKKLSEPDGSGVDEKWEQAKADAAERGKRPPHLRGSALLKESIGSAAP